MKRLLLSASLLLGAGALHAELALGPVFSDGLVLQRNLPVRIWGQGDPGASVTATFQGRKSEAAVAADGRWSLTFAALHADAHPAVLTVAEGRQSVQVKDVLVGEVWLASGQSNMVFPLRNAANAATALAEANDPLLREFRVEPAVSDRPKDTLEGRWIRTTPATAGAFTAVGYFFARELRKSLGEVPVGIVFSAVGATDAEAWSRHEELAAKFPQDIAAWQKVLDAYPKEYAAYQKRLAVWQERHPGVAAPAGPVVQGSVLPGDKPVADPLRAPRFPVGSGDKNSPSGLYNAMIAPLAPFRIRGVIWYQGERDASMFQNYHAVFSALIADWRQVRNEPAMPFYYVQLANFETREPDSQQWAFLREAQSQTLATPGTGMAVSIDVGNPQDIHPRDKETVGHRLAVIALHQVYGVDCEWSGPTVAHVQVEGGTVRIAFDHAEGLVGRPDSLPGFLIAGEDRHWVPGHARIEGHTVIVSSSEVPRPVAVRYAWANSPRSCLYNGAGLPASPFRTDTWAPPAAAE